MITDVHIRCEETGAAITPTKLQYAVCCLVKLLSRAVFKWHLRNRLK